MVTVIFTDSFYPELHVNNIILHIEEDSLYNLR